MMMGQEGDHSRSEGTVEYQLRDTFTSAKDGPMVQFRARSKTSNS
jgi:hypothetical protein